jgi:hypothetical protein
MYKLIVQTIDDGILLLSVVGSNEQYLLDYGINFASGKGYRRNEVEISVSNFPEKFQKTFKDCSIYVY